MLTDIRKFMPMTPQTDDDQFPPYVYEPYPRQMTYMDGKRLKPYLNPDGTPVTVHSASEEAEFRASKGENITHPTPAPTVTVDLTSLQNKEPWIDTPSTPVAVAPGQPGGGPLATANTDKPRRGRPPKPAHVSSMPDDLK